MSRFPTVLLFALPLLLAIAASATERHWQTQEYTLNQRPLSELSGLAASGAHPGYYWAHNDSGDRPTLYLIKPGEDNLKLVSVRGASAADWEDMASYSEGGAHYLLVGDIGDNLAIRPMIDIYLLIEGGSPQTPSLTLLRRYTLVFDGGPRDVEGLAVDPEQRMAYLLSKRERHPKLYRFSLDSLPGEPLLLSALGEIKSLPTPDSHSPQRKGGITQHSPTGLDFAADGSAAVISTLGESYYFARQEQQSWLSVLNTPPQPLGAPPLRQAESIAISRDGNTILLGSEGLPTKLLSFEPTSH